MREELEAKKDENELLSKSTEKLKSELKTRLGTMKEMDKLIKKLEGEVLTPEQFKRVKEMKVCSMDGYVFITLTFDATCCFIVSLTYK